MLLCFPSSRPQMSHHKINDDHPSHLLSFFFSLGILPCRPLPPSPLAPALILFLLPPDMPNAAAVRTLSETRTQWWRKFIFSSQPLIHPILVRSVFDGFFFCQSIIFFWKENLLRQMSSVHEKCPRFIHGGSAIFFCKKTSWRLWSIFRLLLQFAPTNFKVKKSLRKSHVSSSHCRYMESSAVERSAVLLW